MALLGPKEYKAVQRARLEQLIDRRDDLYDRLQYINARIDEICEELSYCINNTHRVLNKGGKQCGKIIYDKPDDLHAGEGRKP